VGLNPRGDEAQLVATLAHELRHAWQDARGFLERLHRSPEDIVWMTRLVEADAEANAVQICWELKEAGYPDAFEAHKKTGYADESLVAYEQTAQADPASVSNGLAMREAFDQWFARPWRRDAYDKGTVEWLEFILTHYRAGVKDKFTSIRMSNLEKLGDTPDGTVNYITAHKAQFHALDAQYYRGGIAAPIRDRIEQIKSAFKFENGKNPHYRPNQPAIVQTTKPPGSSGGGRPPAPVGFAPVMGSGTESARRAMALVARSRGFDRGHSPIRAFAR
jgi:hypothetical protein